MKFRLIILVLFFTVHLFADDLSDRERELRDVQHRIDQQRRLVNEAEDRRRSVEQTKQQTQRQLNLQQRRLHELAATGQNLRSSLELSKSLLNQTETKISELQYAANETLLHILLADQAHEKLLQSNKDPHLLGVILARLTIENRKLAVQRINYSSETETREREFNAAVSRSSAEKSRLDSIIANIQRFEHEIQNIEKQKAAYQAQADELSRAAVALQDLINVLAEQTPQIQYSYIFTNGVQPPVRGRIITPFGPKRHERYGTQTFSNGVDIATPENTPVRAIAEGRVIFADYHRGGGRLVIIDHENGYHSVYSYLNTISTRVGEKVNLGQVIASSGRSPNISEPNLHFEIRRNRQPVNPQEIVRF